MNSAPSSTAAAYAALGPALGVHVVDKDRLAIIESACACKVGAEEAVLQCFASACRAARQRQDQRYAPRVFQELIFRQLQFVDNRHRRVTRVLFAPAHDAVAPADSLLPGGCRQRTKQQPATHSRVESDFGFGAQ